MHRLVPPELGTGIATGTGAGAGAGTVTGLCTGAGAGAGTGGGAETSTGSEVLVESGFPVVGSVPKGKIAQPDETGLSTTLSSGYKEKTAPIELQVNPTRQSVHSGAPSKAHVQVAQGKHRLTPIRENVTRVLLEQVPAHAIENVPALKIVEVDTPASLNVH